MLRNEWKFSYPSSELAEGAKTKVAFHTERIGWWKQRKDGVMAEIRADGLEIEESAALSSGYSKGRDYERGTQVSVRQDLRKQIDECMEKLAAHNKHLRDYEGWLQVLNANAQARFDLEIEDWLFFFGRPA